MAEFPTREAAVESVRPGWKIIGQRPYVVNETVPNVGAAANEPQTITRQVTKGTILSIQGPNGEPDEMTIASAPTPGRGEPAQITILAGPGKAVPGAGTAKPSGQYENVYDPNDTRTVNRRVIALRDTGDQSLHTVTSDPSMPGRQIVTTPTAVFAVDAENKVTKLFDIDKSSPFQAVIVDGKPFRFDPNTGTFTAGPVTEHPDIKDQNGLAMVWTEQPDGSGKYAYPPGVSPPKTMTGAGTQSQYLIWYDATTGQEISRQQNPNYKPPSPTMPQLSATAPMVPIEDPDKPGSIKWIPNEARVMAPDALSNLAAQLSNTVVDPNHPLTLEDAKTIIDAAGTQMTNAQEALRTTMTGAATGAGMLNQRVAAGQGMLGQVLGLAGQRPMVGLAPGAGQAVMRDIQGFTTQLGGGQEVYDTAARLVRAADPQGGTSPMAAAAYGLLTQYFDKFRQQNNADHPLVQATAAVQSSQQSGGMVAPGAQQQYPTSSPAYASGGLGPVMANQVPALANQVPAQASFTAPPLATNNLGNLDPRLRGAIY